MISLSKSALSRTMRDDALIYRILLDTILEQLRIFTLCLELKKGDDKRKSDKKVQEADQKPDKKGRRDSQTQKDTEKEAPVSIFTPLPTNEDAEAKFGG